MRISDLSTRGGVPIPTIKFYLREGLLPPGTSTARNRAEYSESHLTRLRPVRMLILVGQLSVSAVRDVVTALDDRTLSPAGLHRFVNRALLAAQSASAELGDVESAWAQVDDFIDRLGWHVNTDAPGRMVLAQTLAALRRLGWDGDIDTFVPYAGAAERLAIHEDSIPGGPAEAVVARTVLLEGAPRGAAPAGPGTLCRPLPGRRFTAPRESRGYGFFFQSATSVGLVLG
jgi:DNA-binding transcriptional MerR regulator